MLLPLATVFTFIDMCFFFFFLNLYLLITERQKEIQRGGEEREGLS